MEGSLLLNFAKNVEEKLKIIKGRGKYFSPQFDRRPGAEVQNQGQPQENGWERGFDVRHLGQ